VVAIYFISDRSLAPREPAARPILEAVEAGVELVQVREKDLPAREVLALARAAVAAASGGPTEVLVNSRFDIAEAAGAAGVHLPVRGLRASDVRRAGARPGLKVGVSAHSTAEAIAAEEDGADLVTFGPVFETPSKAAYGPPVGLGALREALAAVRIPVYALGGIRPGNVERVLELPVAGVAVVSAIAAAPDRRRAVEELRAAARRARGEGA
jgi:thiamine-phosphate pyrophosphorylase